MKTKLLLFASVLFMLWSCDDALTGTVDTDLEASADVETTDTPGTTKAGEKYFTETLVIDLNENEDVKEYIDQLTDLVFNDVSFILENPNVAEGVTASVEVWFPEYSIWVYVKDVPFNEPIEFGDVDLSSLNGVKDQILAKKKFTVTYTGTISGNVPSPLTFTLKNVFKTTVTFDL